MRYLVSDLQVPQRDKDRLAASSEHEFRDPFRGLDCPQDVSSDSSENGGLNLPSAELSGGNPIMLSQP